MISILRSRWFILLLALALTGLQSRADDKVAPDKSHVYAIGEVERPPKPMITFPPVYPAALKDEGIEGVVVVECVVDFDGVLRDPVVKSSTKKEFELPALQSLAKWKFQPGRKDKKKVNVRIEITVNFKGKK